MTRRRSLRSTAYLASEAVFVWIRDGLVQPLRSKPPLPRAMHFIATHRCNARCVMCGIWKETGTREHELSPEALGEILADGWFAKLEFVGINGGEPFVREDLPELCRVVLRQCSKIKRISLTTNGLLTRRIRDDLPEIADATDAAGALLDVAVSVHGMGETLDSIYGVDDAFAKIERTLDVLERFRDDGRLSFSMNCVLLAENLSEVEKLRLWAADRGIHLSFVIGETRVRFRTEGLESAFVGGDDRQEMIDFLRTVAEDPSQSAVSAGKYREIVAMLVEGKTRTLSCHYAMGGLLLGHDGTLYYCPHSDAIGSCLDRRPEEIYNDPKNLDYRRNSLFRAECRHCPPYTRTRWEIEKDLPQMLAEVVRQRLIRRRRGS